MQPCPSRSGRVATRHAWTTDPSRGLSPIGRNRFVSGAVLCGGTGRLFVWLALCVMTLCGGRCPGASPYRPTFVDPMVEPWRWRSFPELSGLGAQCMAEGADGTIWFGTVEGAWSYDGVAWVSHSSPEGLAGGVTTFCRGTDGVLYAGGRWGIRRYNGSKWTTLFPPSGQTFGEVRKLAAGRDGSLWAATTWGALHVSPSKTTLFTGDDLAVRLKTNAGFSFVEIEVLPETVTGKLRNGSVPAKRHEFAEVCEDNRGRVWLGTTAGEILCYAPSSNQVEAAWSIHNEADGMVCGRDPSILALQDGAVWVVYGASSGRANVFEGGAWRTIQLEEAGAPGDCGNPLQTRDGAVWLSGRYIVGALRDGKWKTYEKPEFPIPTARNFLMQSSDGALWIGGPDTEILRVDYETPRWQTLQDLNFQWESPSGAQWFLHRDGSVVLHDEDRWTRYGEADGLIDTPVTLLGTRSGDVWAAGSHGHTAATARFADGKWTRFIHDELSWGVDWRAVLESSDGSVWFGAAVDSSGPKEHRHGILQYRDGVWTHHHQPGRAPRNADDANPATLLPATQRPEPIGKFLFLGESPDGRIWAGRNILVFREGQAWSVFAPPPDFRLGVVETIFSDRATNLWVGTRQFGALRFDGREWRQFQGRDSLVANSVRSITQTSDGSVWAATDRGVSRFDGNGWTADLLPAVMNIPHEGGSLKASPSGDLWINHFLPNWKRRAWPKAPAVDTAHCVFWTVRHHFKGEAPETVITAGPREVSHLGNLSVLWSGAAPWREAEDSKLQFSYRFDDGEWSAFASESGHSFFALPGGRHRVEVRARDRDFNVDPSPATWEFAVLPPVWRQGWFLLLMVLLVGAVAAQSVRVFLERSRLRGANVVLATEIDERRRTQEEMKATNARYSRQETALMALTRSFAQQRGGVVDLMREIMQVAAQTLEIERASVWRYDGDNRSIVCRELYERSRNAHSGGAAIKARDFPAYFRALEEGDILIVDDAHRDPRTKDFSQTYLLPLGITSMLDAPIHVAGRVAGVFCAEHVGPLRQWTPDEQTFAIAVANVVSLLLAEEERQQIEGQLRQSQKMEAIGQLAGGVAHDFNNMLAVMMMQSELASMVEDLPEEVREGLHEIRAAANRAANLTRQLLLFSRRQVMQLRDLDLNETVTSLAKMLQRIIGEDVRLQLVLHPVPLMTRADAGMLDQVLMNLAVNARDAMPKGGGLTIETSEKVVDEDLARLHPDIVPGRYVCLSVTDTGSGIPPEILPRIFEPFFTTKGLGKGTGLGLATVFGIVKQHCGWLEVDSAIGRGTTFRAFIPSAKATSVEQGRSMARPKPRGGAETILLVEDELSVRSVARTVLERGGYHVLEAANGVEALRLWEGHRENVVLLLTDLVMPEGLSGRELAQRLKAFRPGLKVVYFSGYSADLAGKELDLHVEENFLQKPFGPEVLLETVRRCLDG